MLLMLRHPACVWFVYLTPKMAFAATLSASLTWLKLGRLFQSWADELGAGHHGSEAKEGKWAGLEADEGSIAQKDAKAKAPILSNS